MPSPPWRPQRPKPPHERDRDRDRPDLDDPHTRLVVVLFAAVAMWLVWLASQAALADAATSKIGAPRQLSPANRATVQQIPSFSWKAVPRAAQYEFQLSADPAFRSIIGGARRGAFFTRNTFASISETVADGSYYWRVRAIDKANRAGRWSAVRSVEKRWTTIPTLLGPADGTQVSYPRTPLVLRWEPVPGAFKYLVTIATDPALANSALSGRTQAVETSGTVFGPREALAPGRYYWAVTPVDARKHPGRRSAVSSFEWSWPTSTATRVTDLDADAHVFDPQFSWDPVSGAAQYQIEINFSQDFAIGSRVCCDDAVVGTSHSPLRLLPHNTYYWRVRAVDVDGNAGDWNVGPSFQQGFDPVVKSLRVRDNAADKKPPLGATGLPTTDAPIVSWDPVPGASSYEVTVAPWEGFCNWTANVPLKPTAKTFTTATTSWAPLGPSTSARPVGNAFPSVSSDGSWGLDDGTSYCVRVRARRDRDANAKEIVSGWTQLAGSGVPAFTYEDHWPEDGCIGSPASTPEDAYRAPQGGSFSPRMPLFTWDWVPGACGYFVVVARDAEFTKIVDVALTTQPSYAPRTGALPATYADETTTYYWSVMPTTGFRGDGVSTQPIDNHPQAFQKRSVPPTLISPATGGDVTGQPEFRWSAVESARQYRIQVDDDPTFGSPITDVLTNATGYTSVHALPADSLLYWRVRANDEKLVGLTWSQTGSFRRRLPTPGLVDNPAGGEEMPVLAWAPVVGAVSYDMHVEQVDGTKRDFTVRSTAFTPVTFFGTGVWRWQVRANFRAGSKNVSGGYGPMESYTRRIATPAGARTKKSGRSVLLSWDHARMVRAYRVQIATTDSFSQIVEQAETDNTSWAPKLTHSAFDGGEGLYWRVAALDEGNNLGGWATKPLRAAQRARMRVSGKLRKDRAGRLRITVTGLKRKPLRGAVVRVSGAGIVASPRRTNKRGRVVVRVMPRSRGTVLLSADKAGYAPARARVKVR